MYDRILNEKAVAGEIVDQLRDHTNASLSACIEAAKVVMLTIGEFVSEESFEKIAMAVNAFEIDVNNCRDGKLLKLVMEKLEKIFREKEELSYSVSQNDEQLIEYVKLLSDIVEKTDPRIAFNAVSINDYEWMNSLINLLQMVLINFTNIILQDQNITILKELITCLNVLVEKCPQLNSFLIESKVPVIIALRIPTTELNDIDLSSLELFCQVFSSSIAPPLSHFDNINIVFVKTLLSHFDRNSTIILKCLVAINSHFTTSIENPVIAAMSTVKLSQFGEVFTTYFNKNCSESLLRLLANLEEEKNLIEELFYTNDLEVLINVLDREKINNDDIKIRQMCKDVVDKIN